MSWSPVTSAGSPATFVRQDGQPRWYRSNVVEPGDRTTTTPDAFTQLGAFRGRIVKALPEAHAAAPLPLSTTIRCPSGAKFRPRGLFRPFARTVTRGAASAPPPSVSAVRLAKAASTPTQARRPRRTRTPRPAAERRFMSSSFRPAAGRR